MPANITNGWTGSSLGPSYSVVNSILGGASGTPTTASTPTTPTAAPVGPKVPLDTSPTKTAPLPSTPPVMPPGWNTSSGNTSLGTNSNIASSRNSQVILTPEQSYSQYLLSRAAAENTTPFENTANLLGQGIFLPGPFGTQSNQPGQGFGFGAPSSPAAGGNIANFSPAATQILNQISRGPQFSMAYGTPAAQAPAPTPQWGYPTGYGQQASPSGWSTSSGFSPYASTQSGFGF
jgi:hypothetical protein